MKYMHKKTTQKIKSLTAWCTRRFPIPICLAIPEQKSRRKTTFLYHIAFYQQPSLVCDTWLFQTTQHKAWRSDCGIRGLGHPAIHARSTQTTLVWKYNLCFAGWPWEIGRKSGLWNTTILQPCSTNDLRKRHQAEIRQEPGGQTDVAPTLLGLLNMSYTQNDFGINLLTEQRPYVYFSADNLIAATNTTHLYIYSPHDRTGIQIIRSKEMPCNL